MVYSHWVMSVRPAFSDTIETPLHSRHMELKCHWREEDKVREDPIRMKEDFVPRRYPLCTVYVSAMQRDNTMMGAYTRKLPYMNWDIYKEYRSLARVYDCIQSCKPLEPLQVSASHRETIEHGTSQFLNDKNYRTLHPRRTLDQFYYSSLGDTSSRDRDQTISKWTGPNVPADGRTGAVDQSLIIMVDQLWCWVVDDSTSNQPLHPTQRD